MLGKYCLLILNPGVYSFNTSPLVIVSNNEQIVSLKLAFIQL